MKESSARARPGEEETEAMGPSWGSPVRRLSLTLRVGVAGAAAVARRATVR